MAKKTASSKPASTKKPAAKKAAPPKATQARVLSDGEIGQVSGDVWNLLHSKGPQTSAAIKKAVAAPGDLVMASIGWLAREGKLEFSTAGRTVKVSLR